MSKALETAKTFAKSLGATFLGLLMALGLESWRLELMQKRIARESFDSVMRERLDEILPMQHVEPYIRAASAANVLHRRRILAPPCIREFVRVELRRMMLQERFDCACDAATPVNHRSEYVEY